MEQLRAQTKISGADGLMTLVLEGRESLALTARIERVVVTPLLLWMLVIGIRLMGCLQVGLVQVNRG